MPVNFLQKQVLGRLREVLILPWRSLRGRAAGCNRRSHWHRRQRGGGLLRRAELDEPPRDPSRDHREDEDDSDHHSAQYCAFLSRPDAIAMDTRLVIRRQRIKEFLRIFRRMPQIKETA